MRVARWPVAEGSGFHATINTHFELKSSLQPQGNPCRHEEVASMTTEYPSPGLAWPGLALTPTGTQSIQVSQAACLPAAHLFQRVAPMLVTAATARMAVGSELSTPRSAVA